MVCDPRVLFGRGTRKAEADGFERTANRGPKATIHKILHKRSYTGDCDCDGKRYRGRYEPILTKHLLPTNLSQFSRLRQLPACRHRRYCFVLLVLMVWTLKPVPKF